jgi:hypothetical protein
MKHQDGTTKGSDTKTPVTPTSTSNTHVETTGGHGQQQSQSDGKTQQQGNTIGDAGGGSLGKKRSTT